MIPGTPDPLPEWAAEEAIRLHRYSTQRDIANALLAAHAHGRAEKREEIHTNLQEWDKEEAGKLLLAYQRENIPTLLDAIRAGIALGHARGRAEMRKESEKVVIANTHSYPPRCTCDLCRELKSIAAEIRKLGDKHE